MPKMNNISQTNASALLSCRNSTAEYPSSNLVNQLYKKTISICQIKFFFINYNINHICGYNQVVSETIAQYLWISDNIGQYWEILGNFLFILDNIWLYLAISDYP